MSNTVTVMNFAANDARVEMTGVTLGQIGKDALKADIRARGYSFIRDDAGIVKNVSDVPNFMLWAAVRQLGGDPRAIVANARIGAAPADKRATPEEVFSPVQPAAQAAEVIQTRHGPVTVFPNEGAEAETVQGDAGPDVIEEVEAPPAPTPDAVDAAVASLLAKIGTNFPAFAAEVRALTEKSLTAPTRIVRTVTREVVVDRGPIDPNHVPSVRKTVEAGKLFPLKGVHAKKLVEVYDAQTAPAIDRHYSWHPHLDLALSTIRRSGNLYLAGPRGTGKTSFAEQLAAHMGRHYVVIQCTDQTDAPTLVGMTTPKGWQDGVLAQAIRIPGTVILVDEPSIARPGAVFAFQAVTGPGRSLTIEETGEVVKVAPGVIFILADNTLGFGDELGAYDGTRRLNSSTIDRMEASLLFDYLPAKQEMAVLRAKTNVDEPTARALVAFAKLTRTDTNNGKLTHGVGFRRLLAMAKYLVDDIDADKAFQSAVLNQTAPDDRAHMQQIWSAAWGQRNGAPMDDGAEPAGQGDADATF